MLSKWKAMQGDWQMRFMVEFLAPISCLFVCLFVLFGLFCVCLFVCLFVCLCAGPEDGCQAVWGADSC